MIYFHSPALRLCLLLIFLIQLSKISGNGAINSSPATSYSTFKTEGLQISSPPFSGNVLDEAIWLIRSHYIKSYLYNDSFWETTRHRLSTISNPHIAIQKLTDMFQDPYTRFVPEVMLKEKRKSIRGETLSTGITIKRRFDVSELKLLFRPSIANNKRLDKAKSSMMASSSSVFSDKHHPSAISDIKTKSNNVFADLKNIFKRSHSVPSTSTVLNHNDISSTAVAVTANLSDNNAQLYKSLHELRLVGIHAALQACSSFIAFAAHKLYYYRHTLNNNPIYQTKIALYLHHTRSYLIFSCVYAALRMSFYLYPIISPVEVVTIAPGMSDVLADSIVQATKSSAFRNSNSYSNAGDNCNINSTLKVGDRVMAINGQSVMRMKLTAIRDLLNVGDAGDIVNVSILRKNKINAEKMDVVNVELSCEDKKSSHQIISKIITPLTRLVNIRRIQKSSPPLAEYLPTTSDASVPVISNNKKVTTNHLSSPTSPLPSFSPSVPTVSHYREAHTCQLVRKYILLKRVHSEILSPTIVGSSGVGFIRIQEFTDQTYNEVQDAITTLNTLANNHHNSSLQALILDLQNNPGGPLHSGLDLAALFLNKNTPLLQMTTHNKTEIYKSLQTPRSTNNKNSNNVRREILNVFNRRHHCGLCDMKKISLLLLTNHDTASASEIFATALIDNHRAIVAGSKSMGKNIAQALVRLSDNSAISLTVAMFKGPYGSYMGDGLIPHLTPSLFQSSLSYRINNNSCSNSDNSISNLNNSNNSNNKYKDSDRYEQEINDICRDSEEHHQHDPLLAKHIRFNQKYKSWSFSTTFIHNSSSTS